jgi:hypothetical protein
LKASFAGGYQKYTIVNFHKNLTADDSYLPLTSFVVGGALNARIGPVSIGGAGFYGQNIGTYGMIVGNSSSYWRLDKYMMVYYPVHDSTEMFNADSSEILTDWHMYNSNTLQIGAYLNFKPFEWLSLDGGFGFMTGEHEYKKWFYENFPNTYSWYGQANVKVYDGFIITPEIGQYNYGKYNGFGKYLYWGFRLAADI